jgi:hypothetical protein
VLVGKGLDGGGCAPKLITFILKLLNWKLDTIRIPPDFLGLNLATSFHITWRN